MERPIANQSPVAVERPLTCSPQNSPFSFKYFKTINTEMRSPSCQTKTGGTRCPSLTHSRHPTPRSPSPEHSSPAAASAQLRAAHVAFSGDAPPQIPPKSSAALAKPSQSKALTSVQNKCATPALASPWPRSLTSPCTFPMLWTRASWPASTVNPDPLRRVPYPGISLRPVTLSPRASHTNGGSRQPGSADLPT